MSKRYSIEEIKTFIKESIRNKLLPCEQSEINQQLLREHEIGFEAVLTGHGNEKILLPEDGAVVFLYRGQNKEYVPCYPSLYRESPKKLSPAEIFIWRMRLMLFMDMVDSYPIVNSFFKRHNFKVDYEGLAQHYGLLTSVLDLTSNIDIALFFATCWYDKNNDCYKPFDDDEVHVGIIYLFCPLLDNEPIPARLEDFMKGNIMPIGLQPFLRPARQKGYALHIKEGHSTKSWAYHFEFSKEDSKYYHKMFNGGKDLWISDILVDKTKQISKISSFSFDVFNRAYSLFKPKAYSKTRLKKDLKSLDIKLNSKVNGVYFSEEERTLYIEQWNNQDGKIFCDSICRRPWYEQIGNKDIVDYTKNESKVKVGPVHNFRTLKMIAESAMISLISHPGGPDNAEWINYTNTPNETHKSFSTKDGQWECIPARMCNVNGKRYLTEEDYIIQK